MWRACKDALLVKEALVRRKVLSDPMCDDCKQAPEDALHALWQCSGVLAIWDSNSSCNFHKSESFPKFLDLVLHVISEEKNLAEFAMLIWTFWFCRNKLRVEDKPFPISDVILMANQLLSDFVKANLVNLVSPPTIQSSSVSWSPPSSSPFVKVNFDGAVFKETGEAGLGVMIRDS